MAPTVELSFWSLITRRYATGVAAGVLAVATVLVYLPLAGSNPGAALLASSSLGFLSFLLGTLAVWPIEKKITWQRQLEIVGYRVGATVLAYGLLGVAVLMGLNAVSDKLVPLEGVDGYVRRLPFWPFYAMVILSCQGILPSPPGAC